MDYAATYWAWWWRSSARNRCPCWWRCLDSIGNSAVQSIPSFGRFSAPRLAIESSIKTAWNVTLNRDRVMKMIEKGHKITWERISCIFNVNIWHVMGNKTNFRRIYIDRVFVALRWWNFNIRTRDFCEGLSVDGVNRRVSCIELHWRKMKSRSKVTKAKSAHRINVTCHWAMSTHLDYSKHQIQF